MKCKEIRKYNSPELDSHLQVIKSLMDKWDKIQLSASAILPILQVS